MIVLRRTASLSVALANVQWMRGRVIELIEGLDAQGWPCSMFQASEGLSRCGLRRKYLPNSYVSISIPALPGRR
jgi:hypothetical protein